MDTIQMKDDVISTSITPVVEDKDDDDIDWSWISKYQDYILYSHVFTLIFFLYSVSAKWPTVHQIDLFQSGNFPNLPTQDDCKGPLQIQSSFP